jgi:hypothetical protein
MTLLVLTAALVFVSCLFVQLGEAFVLLPTSTSSTSSSSSPACSKSLPSVSHNSINSRPSPTFWSQLQASTGTKDDNITDDDQTPPAKQKQGGSGLFAGISNFFAELDAFVDDATVRACLIIWLVGWLDYRFLISYCFPVFCNDISRISSPRYCRLSYTCILITIHRCDVWDKVPSFMASGKVTFMDPTTRIKRQCVTFLTQWKTIKDPHRRDSFDGCQARDAHETKEFRTQTEE